MSRTLPRSLPARVHARQRTNLRALSVSGSFFKCSSTILANSLCISSVINVRPDRLFLLALISLFAIHRRRHTTPVRVHPAEWCMLLLFLWGFASLVIAGTIHHPQNRHLATLVNLVGLPLGTLWCVRRSALSQNDVAVVFRVLIGLGIYLAVTAVFEHYGLSALVFPRYIVDRTVGIHWGRSRGPFGNAAVLGGVLSIILVITIFTSEIYVPRCCSGH